MKIGIATMEAFDNRQPNSVGSSRIRGRWLLKYWPEAELYRMGIKYDVLIFQKVYWESMMKQFEGIKILDLCDPDWLEGRSVMEYANLCDAVTTSTEALAAYIRQFVKVPVQCIPDRLELSEFPYRPSKFTGKLRRVVWFGYHQNFDYLHNSIPLLIDYGIELTVIADTPYVVPGGLRGAKVTNLQYKQSTLYEELQRADALFLPNPATMAIDMKGRYKSNNKVIQGWALGIPVITEPDDVDRLNDPEERRKEVEKRYEEVKRLYDVRLSVDEYVKLIGQLGGGNK